MWFRDSSIAPEFSGPSLAGIPFLPVLLAFILGALAAVSIVLISEINFKLTGIVIVAIPIVVITCIRPRIGVLLMLLLIFSTEEFAGGLGGRSVERTLRTPFYSVSVGIPGLYLPDVMVLGLLGLYFYHTLVRRTAMPLKIDMVSIALLMIAGTISISSILSYFGPEPFGALVLDLSTTGSVTLYELIARLIGVLQLKLFTIIFPSYIIGLFYFREERDIRDICIALMIAMMITVVLASSRLIRDPTLVASLVPVIYDTATVWFMALVIFHSIGSWASGRLTINMTVIHILLSAILMLFILLSFRRTLWGAIFLATLVFPYILPHRAWPKLLLLCAVGVLLAGVVFGGTGPGRAIMSSVLERAGETNFANPSTLYRFSLLVYVVQNFFDLPTFGFGITPLWNETVHLRLFKASMENIHSLYFWFLLRFGIFGSFMSLGALGLIFAKCIKEYKRIQNERYKLLVGVIILGIIIFLVDGVFNPVYARVRNLIPLGFAFALLTRLPYIIEPRMTKLGSQNMG